MSNFPVVLFSGGLDSTTLLWSKMPHVKAISFDYGQRHRRELEQAYKITGLFGIEHQIVDVSSINHLIHKGSQAGDAQPPDGRYDEESMKITIVPNRNMIMLAIAVGWAQATGSTEVLFAAHAGDHAIYPDCRAEFVGPLAHAVFESSWPPHVHLSAPFLELSKDGIVALGANLRVPFHLTYSCYKGGPKHCGTCGTCTERKEAFLLAKVPDPTEYLNA